MKTLSIDIETYSSVNLGKSGVYRYAESEDFEILLFSYSADHGPIQVIDMACGEEMPENVRRALTDDSVENGPSMPSLNASVCLPGSDATTRKK